MDSELSKPPLIHSPPFISGRLHPSTLLFRVWGLLRGLLIPILLLVLLGKQRVMAPFFLLVLAGPIVLSVIRYFTFTYRIQAGELVLKHGLLGRTERHIPLNRVQDVRIEQGVLHRLFHVAEAQIDTAGGEGPDAVLSVLALAEAERLRQTIFEQFIEVQGALKASHGIGEDRETLRRVSTFELILAGMTSNKLASLIALLVVAERLAGDFVREDNYQRYLVSWTEKFTLWAQSHPATTWIWVGAALIGLIMAGMLFSVIGTLVRFHGFTLERAGEDLHRSYGLLTRRSSSLPRRRIQVLKIEERLLRRLFRLATLRADTAAGKADHGRNQGGHDVLLPVAPRGEVDSLLPALLPEWAPNNNEWRQVSRRAIYRATLKGTLVCAGLSIFLYWRQATWTNFWPLLFVPVILWLSLMSYRHLGYGLGSHYFRTRRGWLSRSTHIVPIRNTQVVVLEQSPFDRRHRVSTLIVDTAGQAYTGGGPRIGNVPEHEALALARHLAQAASSLRFRV